MKFQCGKTKAEKFEAKLRREFDWHLHFAWWPIKVAQYDCRWLETVERRGYSQGYCIDSWIFAGREFREWVYAPLGTKFPIPAKGVNGPYYLPTDLRGD